EPGVGCTPTPGSLSGWSCAFRRFTSTRPAEAGTPTPLARRQELQFLPLVHLGLAGFPDREVEVRSLRAGGSVVALRAPGQECYLRGVPSAPRGAGDPSLHRQFARLLRAFPQSHLLRDEQTAAHADDLFTHARRARGSRLVVHV